jgi:hypothetical protein
MWPANLQIEEHFIGAGFTDRVLEEIMKRARCAGSHQLSMSLGGINKTLACLFVST